MTIKQAVLEAIQTDKDFNSLNNTKIIEAYNKSDKNYIDNIFIHLCGYSLETLIKQSRKQ